jgi:hypothetical protein
MKKLSAPKGRHQRRDKPMVKNQPSYLSKGIGNTLGAIRDVYKNGEDRSLLSLKTNNASADNITLSPNSSLFSHYTNEINVALTEYRNIGGINIIERSYEIELSLLNGSDRQAMILWDRTLSFMRSLFPDVQPIKFNQYSQKVTVPTIESDNFFIDIITRISSPVSQQVYIKIKYNDHKYTPLKNLPALTAINPKLLISLEVPIGDIKYEEAVSVAMEQSRVRWSFDIDLNTIPNLGLDKYIVIPPTELKIDPNQIVNARIDITSNEITSNNTIENRNTYDIEIELLDIDDKNVTTTHMHLLDVWAKLLSTMMNLDGEYTVITQRKQAIKEFNKIFTEVNPSESFDFKLPDKPVDLTQNDLSWDRSDDQNLPLFSTEGGYYISLKADGQRFYLYFSAVGIFLINIFNNVMTRIGELLPNEMVLVGTTLDVELLNKFDNFGFGKVMEGSKRYQILAFDMISVGEKDIRSNTYTMRHEKLVDFCSNFSKYKFSENVELHAKDIHWLPAPKTMGANAREEFQTNRILCNQWYNTVSKQIKENLNPDGKSFKTQKTGNITWNVDGLMFTPAELPYNTLVTIRNSERQVSTTKKFKIEMTIDFKVGQLKKGDIYTLLSANKTRLIEFRPRDVLQEDITQDELALYANKIVECEWVWLEENSRGKFKIIRVREDKLYPNPITQANDIFRLIKRPIKPEQFYQYTMYIMRNYHNRAKRFIINDLEAYTKKTVLLDLGSGRGGDRDKWTNLSKVYAVEPDEKNIKEFISREKKLLSIPSLNGDNTNLSYTQITNMLAIAKIPELTSNDDIEKSDLKITLINESAQNTDGLLDSKIPPYSADIITMFNILTFFWSSMDMVDSLLNTLSTFCKPDGHVALIAFDGSKYRETMGDSTRWKSNNVEIVSEIDENDKNKIWIKITDGIVRGQIEYLVDLDTFSDLMHARGFVLVNSYYLDQELLMTDEEMLFSSMSKVMIFKNGGNPNKIELGRKLQSFHQMLVNTKNVRALQTGDTPIKLISPSLAAANINSLYRFGSVGDGSCYIHSILRAFFKPYKTKNDDERHHFVKLLRGELADNYTTEIHHAVGNGFFHESKAPEFQYNNIKKLLRDVSSSIGHELMGYIGDQLDVNVYMMRGSVDAKPYKFAFADTNIKSHRKNIVLFWINDNHYETVGQMINKDTVQFVFPSDHPFIKNW